MGASLFRFDGLLSKCAVEQRLARQAHNLEVVGSNPSATINSYHNNNYIRYTSHDFTFLKTLLNRYFITRHLEIVTERSKVLDCKSRVVIYFTGSNPVYLILIGYLIHFIVSN